MEITTRTEGAALVVGLAGHLDVSASAAAAAALDEPLKSGQVRVVADLSQLVFISSAGLRVLLTAAKEARRRGGDVRLAAVQSEDVNKVLRMSGFSNILQVFPDAAQAAASFGA